MAQTQLQKAVIHILEGREGGKDIAVLFNPTEYSLERANSYKATAVPGLGSPLLQFVNGESAQLSMELFLDDFTDRQGPTSSPAREDQPVAQRLARITALLDIDADLHAPPPVRFEWGSLRFLAVLEKVGRKVTMFHPDGTPARATLSVVFKEYRTLAQQLADPRRQSADKSKRRVVAGREPLWLLASREYGDPAEWVRIAAENDLDDPRQVAPGDWLILPPVERPGGPGSAR